MGFLESLGGKAIKMFTREAPVEAVKAPVVPPEKQWRDIYDRRYALIIQMEKETRDEDTERLGQLDKQIADVEAKIDPAELGQLKLQAATREEMDKKKWGR